MGTMLDTKSETVADAFTLRTIRDTEDGWSIIELERDGQVVEIEADELSTLVFALNSAMGG